MSMLSGQCDRLRKAARTERALGHYNLDFLLMDAADTITELRDDLQRANAENDRLRGFAHDLLDAIIHDDGYGIDQGWMLDRLRELGIEVDG